MTWFNFYSHTSQDSYTTFMKTQKRMGNHDASIASILMKTGACVGGTIIGYLSQWVGRRRAMVVAALMSALMIPAWILPTSLGGLSASGFMIQFFIQGAWGVIPVSVCNLIALQNQFLLSIYTLYILTCSILTDPSKRAIPTSFPLFLPRTYSMPSLFLNNLREKKNTRLIPPQYQLGNMISSPSAQIVNAIAESHLIRPAGGQGKDVPSYGPVMGVATAIIALGIAVTAAVGPEKRGSKFENAVIGGQTTVDVEKLGDEEKGGNVEKGIKEIRLEEVEKK